MLGRAGSFELGLELAGEQKPLCPASLDRPVHPPAKEICSAQAPAPRPPRQAEHCSHDALLPARLSHCLGQGFC